MKTYHCFENEDMKKFEAEAKIALLATLSEHGLPHISLITTLQAKDATTLMFGQFSEGRSKQHVKLNPKAGFLIMSLEREIWRGKARWVREAKEGADYDTFNQKPMFRYNSYFGIHTVHYLELVEVVAMTKLALPRIVMSSLKTRVARGGARSIRADRALTPWAEGLFGRMDTLKFIAFPDHDGFPSIVPAIQCQKADANRLVFSPTMFEEELQKLERGTRVAVFGLSMQLESVLTRGIFAGYQRKRGFALGAVDIDWVYNSMPPLPGQIFPAQSLEEVREFL